MKHLSVDLTDFLNTLPKSAADSKRTVRGKSWSLIKRYLENGSGGQASPTFRTTSIEYAPAAFSGHAGAKTMGTSTLEGTRLKSAFHDEIPISCLFSNGGIDRKTSAPQKKTGKCR
jgi:hypothetical protein